MSETLRTFCKSLRDRACPVNENLNVESEELATEYLVSKEDMDELFDLSFPLIRPPEVDGFFRGDKLTGKTKDVIRKYIERLEI